MKKTTLLFLLGILMSCISYAQCELTGDFTIIDYGNNVYWFEATDTTTNCPDAEYFTYSYDFGNGEIANWGTASQQYFAMGIYTVCLTVNAYDGSDNLLATAYTCQEITILCENMVGSIWPQSTPAGVECIFTGTQGGTPPYIYSWTTSAGVGTSFNNSYMVSNITPGTLLVITCTIVDANGCEQTYYLSYVYNPQCTLDVSYTLENNLITFYPTVNGADPGSIELWPYFYSGNTWLSSEWSFYLPTTGSITICYDIESACGAGNSDCLTVNVETLANNCEASFTMQSGPGYYQYINTSTGFYETTSWTCSNGQTSNTDNFYPNLPNDGQTYTVTLTINNSQTGCTSSYSQDITTPLADLACGFAFVDENQNGIFESNESPYDGLDVFEWITGDSTVTDINGWYQLEIIPEEYQITAYAPAGYTFLISGDYYSQYNLVGFYEDASDECIYNIPLVPATSTVCGYAFYDENGNNLLDATEEGLSNVWVTSTVFFENEMVEYSTLTDADGHYCLTLPYQTAYSLLFTLESNGNDITVYQYVQNYFVFGSVESNAPFDYVTAEFDATIMVYPSNPVPGFTTYSSLWLENLGFATANVDVTVTVQAPLTIATEYIPVLNGVAGVISGNQITWSNVYLGSLNWSYTFFYVYCPIGTTLGINLTYSATVEATNDANTSNNSDSYIATVVGSYDPNNKLNDPAGMGIDGQMLPTNDPFTYTINFQNTGSAPAVNIHIDDQLDSDLDWSTLEMLYASHPYTMQMVNGEVVWTFTNIMLPDSTSNEPESHGQIVYRIHPIANKPIGTVFENTAYIYFDFNEPIITNTAINTFVTSIGMEDVQSNGFNVYPNPADEQVRIAATSGPLIQQLVISDITGKTIMVIQNINRQMIEIDTQDLSAGSYLITVNQSETLRLMVK